MKVFDLRLRSAPPRTCPVCVGIGALDRLVRDLGARRPEGPAIVVSDSNVAPLYGEPLRRSLIERDLDAHLLDFPAGERHKTRETKAALEDRLLELGAGRESILIAVGGGVTGDLAGFTAATWHRGVPVIQAPTTLLAMADAALGGKTAVDLPGGKNLVGAFHQPSGVYADTSTLRTLLEEDYRLGFAEVVKSAVIADPKLFRWLERNVEPLLRREADCLEHVALSCLRIKGRVVRRDETEAGRRAVLNFGHTVGHALEAATGYRTPHGRAVAIGMVAEAEIAAEALGFPSTAVARLGRLLSRLGLDTGWPEGLSVGEVVAATRRDKKARKGLARYALPVEIGRMPPGDDVTVALEEELVGSLLERFARERLLSGE